VGAQVSKVSTAAARENVEANGLSNVFIARMSSEEFVEAWNTKAEKRRLQGLDWQKLQLDTLLVDPPRAGLDKDTEQLMKRFHNIVYISCNPETLAQNLAAVRESHIIKAFAVFDQFPFTHHVECGVYLQRKLSS
jgi:tRNA (uracil-5-)-methyltransferase